MYLYTHMGFPGGSDGKESACNMEDLSLISGLGRFPRGGHGNPLQYSCLENPHGLWGHKDLDMTERLSTGKHTVKGFSLINEVKADIFLIPLPFL